MTIGFRNLAWAGLFAAGMTCAQGRQWLNDKGQAMEAEYVSCDGKTVVMERGDKELRYELGKLSPADQEFVRGQMKGVVAGAPVQTGWLRDFVISKPAFPEVKSYLAGRNAKAAYKAFETGGFPKAWDTNKKDVLNEFAYTDGRAIVYVPPLYDGSQPLGVYLHISPGDGGENLDAYAPVMDRLKLIYISPKGTSNGQPMLRRVKLTVDALATVKAQWKVDPKRVFVGGTSGGGHMAMLSHAMFPEMFMGSVSHAAQSYLPANGSCGHFPGLEQGDLKSREFKGHRWCVVSGDKDFNYQEILKTTGEWEGTRFDYRFFNVPGMGHVHASPEKLEEALKWLESDAKTSGS